MTLKKIFSLTALCLLSLCLVINAYPKDTPPAKDLWKHWATYDPSSQKTIDHSLWQQFLKKYVHTDEHGVNLVNYANVSEDDFGQLNDYLWQLSQTDIVTYNRHEQLAFWVNLYNALVIKTILEHYPVSSIGDINISPGFFAKGPWNANLIRIKNTSVSLNDILHRILRPVWNDPRIHFVLCYGAIGSPNLPLQALTADNANDLLTQATKTFVNSPRGAQVIGGQLVTSKLFTWYQDDFGNTPQATIDFIKTYANADLKAQLTNIKEISDTVFNWHINTRRKHKEQPDKPE
jgi:Protein of unknown function, DUF547